MDRSLKSFAGVNEIVQDMSITSVSTTSSRSNTKPNSSRDEIGLSKFQNSNFVKSLSCNITAKPPVKRKLSYQGNSMDWDFGYDIGIEDLGSVSLLGENEETTSFNGVKELAMEEGASFLSSRSSASQNWRDGAYSEDSFDRLNHCCSENQEAVGVSIAQIYEFIKTAVNGFGFEIAFDLERRLSMIFYNFNGHLKKERVETIFGVNRADVTVGEYACYRVFEQNFDFTC